MLIDYHSHILPAMDDGSANVGESLKMLTAAQKQGVELIIATPHYYHQKEPVYEFLDRRDAAFYELAEVWTDQYRPYICCGAEVAFYNGMSGDRELLDLAIAGSSCILIEMPFEPWTASTINEIYSLNANLSLTPIIAHVERYPSFHSKKNNVMDLLDIGAFIQINASFVLSWGTRKQALELLRTGVCFLGSDCHNTTSRPQNMGAAVEVASRYLTVSELTNAERLLRQNGLFL